MLTVPEQVHTTDAEQPTLGSRLPGPSRRCAPASLLGVVLARQRALMQFTACGKHEIVVGGRIMHALVVRGVLRDRGPTQIAQLGGLTRFLGHGRHAPSLRAAPVPRTTTGQASSRVSGRSLVVSHGQAARAASPGPPTSTDAGSATGTAGRSATHFDQPKRPEM